MALNVEIFTLCDYATVSREQKLSIIGIFDQFYVSDIPTNWPKMFLVAVLAGQPNEEYDIRLKITPPEKTEQNFPQKDLRVSIGQNGKAHLITELANFPLPVVGTYKIEITLKKQKVATLEFKVNKTTATYNSEDLKNNKIVN